MQQHPQRGPRRTGSKAVLRKAQHKAQPKGHQRSVQHRPAPGKPQGHRSQPTHRRAQYCPRFQRRSPAAPGFYRQNTRPLCHPEFPAFRRGVLVLFPALCAYTVARSGGSFCRRAQNRPKPAQRRKKALQRAKTLQGFVFLWKRSAVQLLNGRFDALHGLFAAHHAGKVGAAAGGTLLAGQGDAQRVQQPAVLCTFSNASIT